MHDSKEIRDRVWNDTMKDWFDGTEDPNLVILKIIPMEVRVMNKKNLLPKELNL